MSTSNLPAKWRNDADQYMRQVAEANEKGTPHERMAGCADGLREAAKELERNIRDEAEAEEYIGNDSVLSVVRVINWLIEWERDLRKQGGEIGNKDFPAHRMAGKVHDVRREIQERFGLVPTPKTNLNKKQ